MRSVRVIVSVLLAAALAVPASAFAETPDFANDVPGSALPVSPVVGTLDGASEVGDYDDVFGVHLDAGQWIYASSAGQSGTDFDLYLWGPATTSVQQGTPAVYHSETQRSSSERILYKAPSAGVYFLDIWAFDGAGSYNISYGFPSVAPTVTVVASSTCAWGGSAVVKGRLAVPAPSSAAGEVLNLYAKPYGATSWARVGQTTASEAGDYSFSVKPTKRTSYWVRHLGSVNYLPAYAPTVTITPKAYLTAPSVPTTVRREVTFTTSGLIRPRHASGTRCVKVTGYRLESGKWIARRSVLTTNYTYSSTTTRYSGRLRLGAGRWKIVASVTTNSQHAATVSLPRYRTVK